MLNKKALAGTPSTPPAYVEDVFSTYLYSGTGAAQTIANGIDLAGKGGLVWYKSRSHAVSHLLFDTVRGGGNNRLSTNTTDAEQTGGGSPGYGMTYLSNGYSFSALGFADTNATGRTYCSWTFREQPKFFDIVTYTGDGASSKTIAHNLGSTPGMMIVKCVSTAGSWIVYHRMLNGGTNPQNYYMELEATTGQSTSSTRWNNTAPTSTNFTVGSAGSVNLSGETYVAYLFAHDAGGFGTAGTDNVISCGSYTGTGSVGNTIELGYEPQYILIKGASGSGAEFQNWNIYDVMRGMPNGSVNDRYLAANVSDAETNSVVLAPTATGFVLETVNNLVNNSGITYIYMAIRRPMKVPTTGTEVYNPVIGQGTTPCYSSSNFKYGIDASLAFYRPGYGDATDAWPNFQNRLIGLGQLQTPNTRAEIIKAENTWDYMNGYNSGGLSSSWAASLFKRAPGFFDVVCYAGTGATQNITHNLGVAPELMIIKPRDLTNGWSVYAAPLTADYRLTLQTTDSISSGVWGNTTPTASVFTVTGGLAASGSGYKYVAYLFATLAGVSKVGSYTGNGSSQTINCGFAGGARFVLIKRTDSTGDWFVWDTARGIVSGNDPYLRLNSTAAEVTTNDSVDPDNSGFIVNQLAATNINVNAATYIYLAIA
jgi:hypothetical protein